MPQAKTIKQAKAAYKTRNTTNPLTEREQKQLQRSVQLDRRAWSLREREKTRADAVKKRAEREKKASEEGKRMGTQMRTDKFGYKSSQFHLGAFFGKVGGGGKVGAARKEEARVVVEEGGEDEFEDVDDESLLKALDSPEMGRKTAAGPLQETEIHAAEVPRSPSVRNMMPPPPRPPIVQQHKPAGPAAPSATKPRTPDIKRSATVPCYSLATTHAQPHIPDDFDLPWNDFLSTSTQIARELNFDDHEPPETAALPSKPEQKDDLRTTSFSSGFFDFTEEDLEELDPTPRLKTSPPAVTKVLDDRAKLAPPPIYDPRTFARPPPRIDCVPPKHTTPTKPYSNPGFTLTQLESFVDDDLQLTQI